MNMSIITGKTSVEVPLHQPVGLTLTQVSTSLLVTAGGHQDGDILLYRPDDRSVAIIASPAIRSLTVNGQQAHAGLARVENTSLITACGVTTVRFAVLFSDEVSPVPVGASCDICGKALTEEGKSHCRKTLCRACIDVFGGACPDCHKNLTQSDETSAQASALQEYLVSTPQ